MKSAKLNDGKLPKFEVLDRSQLKKVMGGAGGGGGEGLECPDGSFRCTCNGADGECVFSPRECWDNC